MSDDLRRLTVEFNADDFARLEAERERRSKIIHAEGEFQASQKLLEAANIISQNSTTLQLRFLQTLTEVATEKNSTIVFPIPIDLFEPFQPFPGNSGRGEDDAEMRRGLGRVRIIEAGKVKLDLHQVFSSLDGK